MRNKMKNMKTKNPKEYWKLLNGEHKQKQKQPNIPIQILYDFFKELNETTSNDENGNTQQNEHDDTNVQKESNEIINDVITAEEILKCIKKLKNNKASGDDLIINEYIKSTANKMINIYVKLFNIIFNTGIIPESWLLGNINPMYKNKGDVEDPNNFRPITILSCFGKLFTSVLNERLSTFIESFSILHNNQSGFRKNYSTTDHLFILH